MTSRWSENPDVPRGEIYDSRFERLVAEGHDVHGEADFVERLGPSRVLDAGCGTGRIAIELHRRGIEVVGVDLDDRMLDTARTKAPEIDWRRADLASLRLEATFDVVVAAGNVMIFVEPGTETAVVERMADHLIGGGLLVAGFQLSSGGYDLAKYDADCVEAGLSLVDRFSTWDEDPFDNGDYAVSVHAR